MELRTTRQKQKKRKKWLKGILIFILLVFLAVGGYAFYLYQEAKKLVNQDMHNPVDAIDTALTKEKLRNTEKLNVLLLGIDSEEDQIGRSDAIMIMQLNPAEDEMKVISIPRDTRTEIVGRGKEDKINHAFAFGANECGAPCGANMSVATVENLLDIEIDYYVSINMKGLVELVDELGSITVDNTTAWNDGTYDFPEGIIELDGAKTEAYVRMRKKDPKGDFGRTERQRQVIEGIVQKGASIGSLSNITGLMGVLGSNMSTNMDFDDMKILFTNYFDTRKNMTEYMLEGQGTTINGVYYLIVSEEEKAKVHDMLME